MSYRDPIDSSTSRPRPRRLAGTFDDLRPVTPALGGVRDRGCGIHRRARRPRDARWSDSGDNFSSFLSQVVRDWGSHRDWAQSDSERGGAYLGHGTLENRPYAQGTQLVIDEEVIRILTEAGEQATALLTERRHSLESTAKS